jgi:hypothetical protein
MWRVFSHVGLVSHGRSGEAWSAPFHVAFSLYNSLLLSWLCRHLVDQETAVRAVASFFYR